MQKPRLSTIHDDRYIASIKVLIKARKDAGLSQEELADQMGLTQPDISKVERLVRRLDISEFFDIVKIISDNNNEVFNDIWTKVKSLHGQKG